TCRKITEMSVDIYRADEEMHQPLFDLIQKQPYLERVIFREIPDLLPNIRLRSHSLTKIEFHFVDVSLIPFHWFDDLPNLRTIIFNDCYTDYPTTNNRPMQHIRRATDIKIKTARIICH